MYSKPCMKLFMPCNINMQASQLLSPPVSCWFYVASHVEGCQHAPHDPKPGKLSKCVLFCETSAINCD